MEEQAVLLQQPEEIMHAPVVPIIHPVNLPIPTPAPIAIKPVVVYKNDQNQKDNINHNTLDIY